jgi:hypothetical protein
MRNVRLGQTLPTVCMGGVPTNHDAVARDAFEGEVANLRWFMWHFERATTKVKGNIFNFVHHKCRGCSPTAAHGCSYNTSCSHPRHRIQLASPGPTTGICSTASEICRAQNGHRMKSGQTLKTELRRSIHGARDAHVFTPKHGH